MKQGQFDVIESFSIKRKNEFYLIGKLVEGSIQKNWFVNVSLNQKLAMSLRIKEIEDVVITNDENNYKLIVVSGDEETLDFLLALKIGSELVEISDHGED